MSAKFPGGGSKPILSHPSKKLILKKISADDKTSLNNYTASKALDSETTGILGVTVIMSIAGALNDKIKSNGG